MKKYIPLLVAAVVFILAILLLQPESKVPVVVLTNDLPAGHVIEDIDLAVRELPDPSARRTPSRLPHRRSGRRVKPTARRATSSASATWASRWNLNPANARSPSASTTPPGWAG